jgi:hypothetical protein
MTEPSESVQAAPEAEGVSPPEEEALEGRYIPYSGGCMGWYDNSGVLKTELPNNYLYYTIMDSDVVRSRQFQRWGDRFNRRGGRERFRKETGVTLIWGKEKKQGGTKDISLQGMRLQFLEEISLKKGDAVTVQVLENASDKIVVEVQAQVVWSERVGKIRPVQNVGLAFKPLPPEESDRLKEFIAS